MKKLPDQKQVINRMMRITGARNFAQLEKKIGSTCGVTSRVFHNEAGISHSFFLKMLFYTGMTAERLCEETGIPKGYFFERGE